MAQNPGGRVAIPTSVVEHATRRDAPAAAASAVTPMVVDVEDDEELVAHAAAANAAANGPTLERSDLICLTLSGDGAIV